jgi:aminoglycoside phosphotransferase (APT) family kinase protein
MATHPLPPAIAQIASPPFSVERLSGGYSWLTYAVRDAAGQELIVRVAPGGGTLEPYDPAVERLALERVAGLLPAPKALLSGPDFIVQSRSPGRVLRPRDVSDVTEQKRYGEAFARALGRLHTLIEAATIGEALASQLARARDLYERFALRRYPGFEHGLLWLEKRLPDDPRQARFCHGDYRFSNIAWTEPGVIGGVLDWERSEPGDPMADVAFTRLYSGWCSVAGPLIELYEAESALVVDEERVAYLVRFERLRSFTASMRGHRAFMEGRSTDPRLKEIGEAGEHGMEELLTWD